MKTLAGIQRVRHIFMITVSLTCCSEALAVDSVQLGTQSKKEGERERETERRERVGIESQNRRDFCYVN